MIVAARVWTDSPSNWAELLGPTEVQIDVRQAEALFDVLDYNNSGTLDSEEFLEAKKTGECGKVEWSRVRCGKVWGQYFR